MELDVHIKNIKSISDLSFSLPIDAGIYAITGLNGSGKSTIVESISSVLFWMSLKDHCGDGTSDASIELSYNGDQQVGFRHNHCWNIRGNCGVSGFYEGSLIFGSRFRNNSFISFKNHTKIDKSKATQVNDFVKKNMGYVLHGKEEYYDKIWAIPISGAKVPTYYFYYERKGTEVGQYYMSTGENLLLNILFSIDTNILSKKCEQPRIVFLDEIEMALHPLSLKRLSSLLKVIAIDCKCAIYFSTHSIELIHAIEPSHIMYIQKDDDVISIKKKCYHAFVTRNLYMTNGYDRIILVEDILAKRIIDRILREQKMLSDGRLVCVVPAGGYLEVLQFAKDAVNNAIFGNTSKVIIVLDGDCKEDAQKRINNMSGMSVPLNFLPIASLEKYLRTQLVTKYDKCLHDLLSDYVFRRNSLDSICEEYLLNVKSDNDSKKFYGYLERELNEIGVDPSVLCEEVVKYLFDSKDPLISKLTEFLQNKLA